MLPEEVRTTAQARAIVEERGLHHVKVGVFDNDGILRGKYIDREKFFAALDKGIGFCDVVLGWDSNDQQYDNVKFTGWHTAYPDAMVRAAARDLPRAAARGQHAAVPRRVYRQRRAGLSARHAAPRAAARGGHGLQHFGGGRVRVLRLQRNARERARQGLSRAEQHDARVLRLFHAAQLRARRAVPGAAAAGGRHAHADRGPAHRDRARA